MFAWNEAKRLRVIEEHRVDFATLTDAFNDAFGVYFSKTPNIRLRRKFDLT